MVRSATSVKSTGVSGKFLSELLPLRKTLFSHVERKSRCSAGKTNGQVMAFISAHSRKKGNRRHGLRDYVQLTARTTITTTITGADFVCEEARPRQRREFRHGRHGQREETANRITLGGHGRFLTVDLPRSQLHYQYPSYILFTSVSARSDTAVRSSNSNIEKTASLTLRPVSVLKPPLLLGPGPIWYSLFRHARGSKLAADVSYKPPGTGTTLMLNDSPLARLRPDVVSPLYLLLNTRP